MVVVCESALSLRAQVWLSLATFEANEAQDADAARSVFRRASDFMKQAKAVEERVLVIEAWYKFELSLGEGNASNIADVAAKRPRREARKRLVVEGDEVRFVSPSVARARPYHVRELVSPGGAVCARALPHRRAGGRTTPRTCSRTTSAGWAA